MSIANSHQNFSGRGIELGGTTAIFVCFVTVLTSGAVSHVSSQLTCPAVATSIWLSDVASHAQCQGVPHVQPSRHGAAMM